MRRHAVPATALAAALGLAACAAPSPGIDLDRLTRASNPDPARNLALMRAEGERIAHAPFVPGNRATLLINGPAAFAALADAITRARVRIDMESYEFDDTAGGQFAPLLLAARARGVAVNLIHDAWGTLHTSAALFARLRAGGVRVLEYNPLLPSARVLPDINDRDHRKLLCVDGQVAITGGVNISQVYQNAPNPTDDPDRAAWRDTDVRLEGPVVAQFEALFLKTWQTQNGPPLAPPPPAPPPPGDLPVQAIGGAPELGEPLIYRSLLATLALARHSAHLTTGFFVPTPDLREAFIAAARRGVDVRIIVPGRSTSDASVAAGRTDYGDLLEAGVRIHEYRGRILHAKTAVIDGAWTAIGSSNLDWRSTLWNNEIDAVILSPAFGADMEAAFRADLAASHAVTLTEWRHRGLREIVREWRALLIERLL